MFDGIVSDIIEKIDNYIGRLFYYIEMIVCSIVKWMQGLFDVFTGTTTAKYQGEDMFLTTIFFGNSTVNAVFWGMALLGVILTIVFAIIAVARKAADLDDKARHSHGQIIRSSLKSIIIILLMSVAVNITITSTNVLMIYVSKVFDAGDTLTQKNYIEYTPEQYASMARILNTVGNYSLNPSYNNRYNLMNCYNNIRPELKFLADQGVFSFDYNVTDSSGNKADSVQNEVGFRYETRDSEGKIVKTWQSLIQKLANAGDYNTDMALDEYNEGVANALMELMTELKTNRSFSALKNYTRQNVGNTDNVGIDRVLFLSGTFGWGNNDAARVGNGKAASMYDTVRFPYYTAEKDMYDIDQVNEDFYVNVSRMNYFLIYLVGMAIVVNMAVIIANCIVRLFNLLFLYIIAPPIIAVTPLDDGAKFKQWLTAFIVQAFSVFATVISMRLFLIFIPIVMRADFQLSDNAVLNVLGKLVMVWAGTIAIQKANGLMTGILADNAGMQSIMAGSTESDVKNSAVGRNVAAAHDKVAGKIGNMAAAPVNFAAGAAKGVAKGVAKVGWQAATLPVRPLIGGLKNAGKHIASAWSGLNEKAENSIIQSPSYKASHQQQSEQPQQDQSGGANGIQPQSEQPQQDQSGGANGIQQQNLNSQVQNQPPPPPEDPIQF